MSGTVTTSRVAAGSYELATAAGTYRVIQVRSLGSLYDRGPAWLVYPPAAEDYSVACETLREAKSAVADSLAEWLDMQASLR